MFVVAGLWYIKKGKPLHLQDRALMCCEAQELLASLHIVPDQQTSRYHSTADYAGAIDREKLYTLAHVLAKYKVEAVAEAKLSKCRREFVEVNKHWPRAKGYTHTSVIAQNFSGQLPKIEKA